ncbi:transposase, partial [Candidatus Dependentiae bacterium]|nr:transposase [Candidatus Dependentiae bacterium]
QKRLSIISAFHENTLKAPFVFEGSCNREVFETYLLEVLLPVVKPGQTISMDNASFHKNGNIKALIEKSAGCDLLYLQAYSPDFNPIDK